MLFWAHGKYISGTWAKRWTIHSQIAKKIPTSCPVLTHAHTHMQSCYWWFLIRQVESRAEGRKKYLTNRSSPKAVRLNRKPANAFSINNSDRRLEDFNFSNLLQLLSYPITRHRQLPAQWSRRRSADILMWKSCCLALGVITVRVLSLTKKSTLLTVSQVSVISMI